MKKLILFSVVICSLFFISQTNAGCLFSYDCPTEKINCPKGEFMGDDGKCYSCDIDKAILAHCLGHKELEKICPNRVHGKCGDSFLKCPERYELVGKYCEFECPDGYIRDNNKLKGLGYNTACCNEDGCLIDK